MRGWAAIATQSDARLGSQEIVFPRLQALQLAYQTFDLGLDHRSGQPSKVPVSFSV